MSVNSNTNSNPFINGLNVITTVQPTPTPTGNLTNLNSTFKDANGDTWIVDSNGDAIQAGNAPFKNLNEFHVDPNGSDVTGDGSQEKPFQTIGKAVSVAVAGDQVIVHAGVYNENVTLSNPNVALVGAQSEYGALTQINGSVTVTATGTSVKIADIGINSVVHSGSAPLYLENVTVYTTFNSSSAGYVEISNSSIQDGAITKSAGIILIEESKIDNVSITGTNTVGSVRNSYQDLNSTITYGAGTVYNIQNVQGGEVVINAAAIPLETAALGQGLSAEMAKEAETADFMKLGMLRPDLEASPTKIVTWDEITGRLEVSNLSSIASPGAPVTTGTAAPTGTSIEGAIHLVTDDGTPTGTVLEQYIYDTESGTWIQMMRNAQDTLKFGTASPTSNGAWDGEEYFVTSTGTSSGTVLEQWIWDKQSSTWVKRPSENVSFGSSAPVSGNGAREGDEYFVTSTGTSTGVITAQYIYDGTSASWILRPSVGSSANWVDVTTDPSATGNTTNLSSFTNNTVTGDKFFIGADGKAFLVEKGTIITSLKPQNQNVAGTWTDAQANSLTNVCDAVLLSTGDRVKYGKYTFTGHGFQIGANLYLSKSLAGVLTATAPLDGDVSQAIAFVHDANTIEILVQQAYIEGSSASTTNSNLANTSATVARGVDVQLDNIKVRFAATGNLNMQISTITGSFNASGRSQTLFGASSAAQSSITTAYTTTPTSIVTGWNLTTSGDTQITHLLDTTNGKAYRISGVSVNATVNQITIERI